MSDVTIDDTSAALLRAPNFAHVVTRRKDGSLRVAVTWIDLDAERHLVLNSALDRRWYRDLLRDPSLTVTVVNRENPYEYVVVHGRLVEERTDGADGHIDFLAKKYLGEDRYPWRMEGEERVLCRIAPERVSRYAG